MHHRGKIGQLSNDTQEKLNQRISNNENGAQLLHWLNSLPETRQMLKEQFNGAPISKQNLSEWRAGGYAEWAAFNEIRHWSTTFYQNLTQFEDFEIDAAGFLADHLATAVAARYAKIMATWDGEPNKKVETQLKVLAGLNRNIAILQTTMRNADDHKNFVFQRRKRQREEEARKREMDRFQKALFSPEGRASIRAELDKKQQQTTKKTEEPVETMDEDVNSSVESEPSNQADSPAGHTKSNQVKPKPDAPPASDSPIPGTPPVTADNQASTAAPGFEDDSMP